MGAGPNGVVVSARHRLTGRSVAVKFLGSEGRPAADPALLTGYSRALSSIRSPHLVALHAAGIGADGVPYLISSLATAGSLADRLARHERISLLDAQALMRALAKALDVAHAQGVVHGAVKPANVVLLGDGVPALTDLALGRLLNGSATVRQHLADPGFAAPEVLLGGPPSVRSDVYSLAATVLAALQGWVPEPGRHGERRVPTLPRPVARVLSSGMARQPAGRPPSAGALADAFDAALRSLAAPGASPSQALPARSRNLLDEHRAVAQAGRATGWVAAGVTFVLLGALSVGLAVALLLHR